MKMKAITESNLAFLGSKIVAYSQKYKIPTLFPSKLYNMWMIWVSTAAQNYSAAPFPHLVLLRNPLHTLD